MALTQETPRLEMFPAIFSGICSRRYAADAAGRGTGVAPGAAELTSFSCPGVRVLVGGGARNIASRSSVDGGVGVGGGEGVTAGVSVAAGCGVARGAALRVGGGRELGCG